MKTRAIYLTIAFCCLFSCAAIAQDRWKSIPAEEWGFTYKLPPSAVLQPLAREDRRASTDLYIAGGFAFLIEVNPTPADALASTVIEQTIQADTKEAGKLGATTRWEATSKQGDLFKGFSGQMELKTTNAVHAPIIKAIGGQKGTCSVALAPLGDESAPVLKISVVGKTNREAEVVAMAKMVSSLVTRQPANAGHPAIPKPPAVPTAPPEPEIAPMPVPMPTPAAKPWPALEKDKIELTGVVDSISADGKTLMITVDVIKLPGQDAINLSPKRSKKVLLHNKLNSSVKGLRIRLIGKNSGVGKPITADAVELTPNMPEPETGPPSPMPLS